MASKDTVAALTETFAGITRTAGSPALLDRIRELSGVALNRSGLVTLWRLANFGPQLISELADGVGVDVSTMSRLLRQLERDGLVERGRHGTDLRCVYITITAAGERAHGRVSEARTAMLTEVLEDWSQRDRDTFVRLLGRFAGDLSEHLERSRPAALAAN
jgi:DNA-binding MarR family transcriptional regulator